MDIWEGIDRIIYSWENEDTRLGGKRVPQLRERIIAFLNDNGVVKKVDVQLPDVPDMLITQDYDPPSWYKIAQKDMLRTGYTLTDEV